MGEAAFPSTEAAAPSRRRAMVVLIGLGLAAVTGLGLWVAGAIPSVHAYYLPSEGMMPTLAKGDQILAATGVTAPFTRGEIILFRTGRGETYIKRVAGLPGDRIALVGGQVVLNGKAVAQQPRGTAPGTCDPSGPARPAQRLSERFPGEALPHQIQDCGPSMADDFAEQRVAPGHLFVLGDNRDDSADSRIPPELGGVSQVAIADVAGRAPIYTAAPGRRFGQPVR